MTDRPGHTLYLPIARISIVLNLEECQQKCARLNSKNPGWHFKPRPAGSGYQVVAASPKGNTSHG